MSDLHSWLLLERHLICQYLWPYIFRPLRPIFKNGHNDHTILNFYDHKYVQVICFSDHNREYRAHLTFELDWICNEKVMAKTSMADFYWFPLYFGHKIPFSWGTTKSPKNELNKLLVCLWLYTFGIKHMLKKKLLKLFLSTLPPCYWMWTIGFTFPSPSLL